MQYSNSLQIETKNKKKRKTFTPDEDEELKHLVKKYGTKRWDFISSKIKTRNARQCRERWKFYLSPNVNRSPWTSDEDQILFEKYNEFGPKWSIISKYFHNRSLNNVKNRWNSIMRKIKSLKLDVNSDKDFHHCGRLLAKSRACYQMDADENDQILENNEKNNCDEHKFDPFFFLQISNLLNQIPEPI